jgi:acetoin utilization deacetylase AcuC-like enzyme
VVAAPGTDAEAFATPADLLCATHEWRVPSRIVGALTVLLTTSPRFFDHDTGPGHPERPGRLEAVLAGARRADLVDAVVPVAARPATRSELETVHPAAYLDALEAFCAEGGGAIDGDTHAVTASWEAAVLAAGAGVDAADRLAAGEADAAFCAVRPPGHHATPRGAMGFCLVNSAAVTAAVLAGRGERVVILDWDAHHGNGTQDAFYADGRVLYVSLHQWPLYPGTGQADERGEGDGRGTTLNVPLPPRATGDVYLRAMDELIAPAVDAFAPTWLLVSAGYDAHRADPLTDLGLSSGDFADLAARALALAPAGRRILFLEGGYDLEALADSTAATLGALVGIDHRPERATSGGPGMDLIDALKSRG